MVFLGLVMMPFYYAVLLRLEGAQRPGVPVAALQPAHPRVQRADVRHRERAHRRREPLRAGPGHARPARLAAAAGHIFVAAGLVLAYIMLGGLSAARRTPLIGAYPKIFIPALTIIPGLVALVT